MSYSSNGKPHSNCYTWRHVSRPCFDVMFCLIVLTPLWTPCLTSCLDVMFCSCVLKPPFTPFLTPCLDAMFLYHILTLFLDVNVWCWVLTSYAICWHRAVLSFDQIFWRHVFASFWRHKTCFDVIFLPSQISLTSPFSARAPQNIRLDYSLTGEHFTK